MELYFYNECGFSQSVLNCMTNLHCEDQIIKKTSERILSMNRN